MNNNKCIECSKYIYGVKNKGMLYRCGDANVCSLKCSNNRYKKLLFVDPDLEAPIIWSTANNESYYIFNKNNSCNRIFLETTPKIKALSIIKEETINHHNNKYIHYPWKYIIMIIIKFIKLIKC
tara:strand:- start:2572 stop:2943 length:372 start_codon:yes stop_codon:yes gene_type:complete